MTMNDNQNLRPVVIAVVAASVVLVASSVVYRVLAGRLAAPVSTFAMTSEDMQKLPLKIGDWVGNEEPLAEEIVKATDTDAHINRGYSLFGSSEQVLLYIAYGVKARDLMPHRPEVCYIGAGWTLDDKGVEKMDVSGRELPYTLLEFSRGSLQRKKNIIANYYIVDGQYCSDVSLLRSKAWKGSGAIGYMAQVQIVSTASTGSGLDAAVKRIKAFAGESAPIIMDLFENRDNNPDSNQDKAKDTSEGRDDD